jgi:PAS domain S-box-containing protein
MAIPSAPGRLALSRSLVWRNLLLSLLILLVAVVPLGWRYYADSRAYEIQNLAAQLAFFAARGASWIDVAAIPQLTQPAHMHTPMYQTLVRTLNRIEREFDVDNAIIMRREADGQYTYVAAGAGGAGTNPAGREAYRNPCNPRVATEEGVFALGKPVHLHAWFPATYTATNEAWQRGEMQHSQLFGGKVGGKTFDHFVQINTPLKLHDQVVAIVMLNKFANPVAAAVRTKTLKIFGLTVGIVVVGLLLVRSHTPFLKRLEASEAQFRALLESEPDGLVIVNARGEIVLVNQQAETLFRYAREELLGQPVEMLMPARFRDSHRQHRGAYVAAPQVRPMGTVRELCGLRKDGSEFPVEVGLSPLDAVGGRLVISAIRDITARKQMEEALHQACTAAEQANRELAAANRCIRQIFGRYVSDEVVASVLDDPDGLQLGGEERTVTLLMSDLRGFTAFAERLSPTQVVAFLNRYLDTMVKVIMAYHGTIDEIIGDGLFVLFGAPIQREDDAARAVACAVAMQVAMEEVNAQNRRAGLPEVAMGIGLHTGTVVVGNIGSPQRTKYGAVGSHVNLTGRIESYTIGRQILLSADTAKATGSGLRIDGAIQVEPKGVHEVLTLYDVGGIGSPYNLFLPEKRNDLVPLETPLALHYTVLEEKHVGRTVFTGHAVKLSTTAMEICTAHPLPALSNVKMWLMDSNGEALPGALYGKVIGPPSECAEGFVVRFTSVTPEAIASLQAICAACAPVSIA